MVEAVKPLPAELSERKGIEGDLPFVVESWLSCDRISRAGRDESDSPGYVSRFKVRAKRIIARSELRVICAADDPNAILAWAVVLPVALTVFYVYVRPEARRLGLASWLLRDLLPEPCVFTHRPIIPGVRAPEAWMYDREPNYVGAEGARAT